MSDIILGNMARINFGFRKKYEDDLIQEYKTYLDALEKDIITSIYGTSVDNCIINRTYTLIINENDNDTTKYSNIELPLIKFCRQHNIFLKILRYDDHIDITLDLLLPYMLNYE